MEIQPIGYAWPIEPDLIICIYATDDDQLRIAIERPALWDEDRETPGSMVADATLTLETAADLANRIQQFVTAQAGRPAE